MNASTLSPPPNITAQSDDNRVGIMLVTWALLLYGAWRFFSGGGGGAWAWLALALPGGWLVLLSVRRLLRPGCRMLLRVNHGGITDFRLSVHPIAWESVAEVERLSGPAGLLMPVVLLRLNATAPLPEAPRLWFRTLHLPLGWFLPRRVAILCGTLDVPCSRILEVMRLHLAFCREKERQKSAPKKNVRKRTPRKKSDPG